MNKKLDNYQKIKRNNKKNHLSIKPHNPRKNLLNKKLQLIMHMPKINSKDFTIKNQNN